MLAIELNCVHSHKYLVKLVNVKGHCNYTERCLLCMPCVLVVHYMTV